MAHKIHLRMLYSDPFGKQKNGWKLLHASDGGISGVSSKSAGTPIKTGNFQQGYEKFEDATSYADWVFEFVPASGGCSTSGSLAYPTMGVVGGVLQILE